MGITPENI